MSYEGFQTLEDVDVTGKRVLLRAAYDTALETVGGQIRVADDSRLRASLPTIEWLLEAHCSIVICGGKLGRPKGEIVPALRMDPVAVRLSELLGRPVQKLDDCVGEAVEQAVSRLAPGEIVLLENARFYPEEFSKDESYIAGLARLGELCVFDAFAEAHRDMASTTGLVRVMPTVLGPLMVSELSALSQITHDPARPFVVVLGGAKITDKIGMLRRLVDDADQVVIGGAMANVFLKSRGADVGASVVESADIDGSGLDPLELARDISVRAGHKLVLPTDFIAGDDKRTPTVSETVVLGPDVLPTGHGYFDIGPASRQRYADVISTARTIFWNGTMGVNTTPVFAVGTQVVAQAIAKNKGAITIAGGGDTAEAAHQFGVEDKFTHVSTGGGASLKVVSGEELAVLKVLKEKNDSLSSFTSEVTGFKNLRGFPESEEAEDSGSTA